MGRSASKSDVQTIKGESGFLSLSLSMVNCKSGFSLTYLRTFFGILEDPVRA